MKNIVFEQLFSFYELRNIPVRLSDDNMLLQVKQGIEVDYEWFNLLINVLVDDRDHSLFHFVCYGLGQSENLTNSDREKIVQFNNKSDVKLQLDENNNYVLTFSKHCYNTNYFSIASKTAMEEFLDDIGRFYTVLKERHFTLISLMK